MRQADLDDLRALRLQPVGALLPEGLDLGGHVVDPVFLGDADLEALDVAAEQRAPVGGLEVDGGAVLGVVAGHCLEQEGGVLDVAAEGAGLVERGGEGDDAEARAAAVGGLDAGDAAEGGGLADGAAGVGAGGGECYAGRHGGSRAAGAAARDQGGVVGGLGPGVADGAVVGGHVGRAHGELVEIGLAERDGAGGPELGGDGQFVRRLEAVEDVRAGGGEHALGAEQVLDGDGQAFEEAGLALGQARIGGLGHRQRLVRCLGDEGVEVARGLHGVEMGCGELDGGDVLGREAALGLGEAEMG